jgi:hypothetical protein
MSTRACYRFIPENGPNGCPGVITVYKHQDGYPRGAAEAIERALPFAWPLPRYENDEFAAGFVAGNKMSAETWARRYEADAIARPEHAEHFLRMAKEWRDPKRGYQAGGGVRLVPFEGMNAHARFAADTEYLYEVRCVGGKIRITAFTTVERDNKWWVKKFFEGSIKQLAKAKVPESHDADGGPPDFELP